MANTFVRGVKNNIQLIDGLVFKSLLGREGYSDTSGGKRVSLKISHFLFHAFPL